MTNSDTNGVETDLETVCRRIADAIITVDADERVTYCNEQASSLFATQRDELTGQVLWEQFPTAIGTRFKELYQRAMETQEAVDCDVYHCELERWFAVRAHPSRTGVSTVFRDITEQKQDDQQLARNYERLTTIIQLDALIRQITHTVFNASSRTHIEQRVCDRLVDNGGYPLVWIGRVGRGDHNVTPICSASREDHQQYLNDIRISIDSADPASQGPTGTAIRTREPQVLQDIQAAADYEPWQAPAAEHGFAASAAFPLVYDDVLYGVLNIYASTTGVFNNSTQKALVHLSDIVGQAVHTIEQRTVLTTDSMLELEFRNTDLAQLFTPAEDAPRKDSAELALSVERTVQIEDGSILQIVTARGKSPDQFIEAFTRFPSVDDVFSISEGDSDVDGILLGLKVSKPSLSATLAAYNGYVRDFAITPNEIRLIAELPPETDTRMVTEALQDIYPDTELLAQRTRPRANLSQQELTSILAEQLTDKQRAALGTAYHTGYFEWPRTSTGEDIAKMLDIAAPTFTEHLRAAERNLLTAIYEGE